MKHAIFLFCLVALAGCGSKDDVFTPETLGEHVVSAFVKNDPKAFHTYYITPDEIKEKVKPEERENFMVLYQFIYDNTELTFRRILQQGDESGVDWKQVKYKGVEYKIINGEKTDIYVYFTSAGKTHRLKLDDCLLTDKRGWRLNDDVTYEN